MPRPGDFSQVGCLLMLLSIGPWAEIFAFGTAAGIRVGWVVAGGMWIFAGLYVGENAA